MTDVIKHQKIKIIFISLREIHEKIPIYNALTNCVLHDPAGPGLGRLLKLTDIPKLFGSNLVVCPEIQGDGFYLKYFKTSCNFDFRF